MDKELILIKRLIADDKIETALDRLEELVINAFKEKSNEIILLNRRLKSIRKNIYLGLSDGNVEINKLSKDILDFVETIQGNNAVKDIPQNGKKAIEKIVAKEIKLDSDRAKHKLELQLNTLKNLDFKQEEETGIMPFMLGITLLFFGIITYSEEAVRFLSYLFIISGISVMGYVIYFLNINKEFTLIKAKMAARKGLFDKSNLLIKQVIDALHTPRQTARFFNLSGNNNYELEKNTEALKDFQKVIFLMESGKAILPKEALAIMLGRMGDIIKSDSLTIGFLYFAAASDIKNNPELAVFMANGYLEMKRPDKAKSVLKEGAKLDNGSVKDLDKIQQLLELIPA